MFAESSSIHSMRVRCAAGKSSVAKASISADVRLSSPRIWTLSSAGSREFGIVVSLGVERIGLEVSGCCEEISLELWRKFHANGLTERSASVFNTS